jgi:sulfoxide reductase catalytic subunit YedY
MLESIVVMDKDEPVFYTDKAYRLPNNELGSVPAGADMPQDTRPLKRLKIKSVIAEPGDASKVKKGDQITLAGVAFDSGFGIQEVLVSIDGGTTWTSAQLEKDLGRYAFRKWSYRFTAVRRGEMALLCRAINRLGETQPLPEHQGWNPAGYQWNAADRITIHVA